jgi:hypothetical protein
MKATGSLHTVWAYRPPTYRLCAITQPLPRANAVRVIQIQWNHGIMARLEPPLHPTTINLESSHGHVAVTLPFR